MAQVQEIPLVNQQVKKARERLRLDQYEVATAIGKARSSLSKIENGTQNVPRELIEFYNRKFNVSLDWIYRNTGEMIVGGTDNSISISDVKSGGHSQIGVNSKQEVGDVIDRPSKAQMKELEQELEIAQTQVAHLKELLASKNEIIEMLKEKLSRYERST